MLSTHMQRSQVEELSALTSRLPYLTLTLPHAYLTLRCRSSTPPPPAVLAVIPVNVAVYLGSCLCTVLTGSPQAAVATATECRLGCR